MSAPAVERSVSEQTLCALADVSSFAEDHSEALAGILPQIRRGVAHPQHLAAMYAGPRLCVSVPDADEYETLTDLIVAARSEGLPVGLDWSGSYLWVDVHFGGVTLRVQDAHTSVGARGILGYLVSCPSADAAPAAAFDKAVKAFMRAHRVYRRAFENPTPDPDAERLFGEVRKAWLPVSAGIVAGRDVGMDVMDAVNEYAFPAVSREPVAERVPDWSRGRR